MTFFEENAIWMMDRLIVDFDLSVEDAAAIIGNAGHESGGFKSLQEKRPVVPGSRGGYGIMQWTGPRRRSYEAYCNRNDLDPAEMESNYKFLFVELMGPEGKVLKELKASRSLEDKTFVFMKKFLRPGIPHEKSRQVWARKALNAYNKAPKEVKPTPTEVPKVEVEVTVKEHWFIKIIKLLFGIK